jgi:hypothetical protein
MEQGRYDITLGEVPAEIIGINQVGVAVGLMDRHTEPGYVLADGTVLLESEKDEAGFYIGGAGMDGMYLATPDRYEPVRDDDGHITAFRHMSRWLTHFTAGERETIFQYGMNTRDNLVQDLAAALPQLKKAPQVYDLFSSTVKKLCQVPDGECRRLMADIRAAYKGREEQSIRDRQRAAQKSVKKKRSMER